MQATRYYTFIVFLEYYFYSNYATAFLKQVFSEIAKQYIRILFDDKKRTFWFVLINSKVSTCMIYM